MRRARRRPPRSKQKAETMAEHKHPTPGQAAQTTGHAWDGDLQEYNNPLPTWWLWAFYASVIFAVVYWVFYPAWPVGRDYTKGLSTVTFERDGEPVTMHWNTRAALVAEMQSGEQSLKQQAYLQQVADSSYAEIAQDPEMMAFTRSMGKVIFADNCAACHGVGGNPAQLGQYPNLADDAWLWGGAPEQIEATIAHGRLGFMPAYAQTLDDGQLDDVASYVLSLSALDDGDAAAVARGAAIFNGETGGCYYCHTTAGTGLTSQGSANLTDAVWTVADVPGAADAAERHARVRALIHNGVQRQMPAWDHRLSPEQIKLLTVYVGTLGGGS